MDILNAVKQKKLQIYGVQAIVIGTAGGGTIQELTVVRCMKELPLGSITSQLTMHKYITVSFLVDSIIHHQL